MPYGISPFYRAVLNTWFQVRDRPPSTELEIRSQVIWENHWISSPQHFLKRELWKRWMEAGILLINNICHDTENRLLGHEEMSEKFLIRCNFLEALTIRNSIPHAWRSKLTSNFQEEITLSHLFDINGTKFDPCTSSPRGWYSEWVRALKTPFSRENSWNRELANHDQNANPDWRSMFLLPYKTTRETKLQSFAYKVIYRLCPCNMYLSKVRIKPSDTCSFCPEVDSLSHFFLECQGVRPFWERLAEWCKDFLDLSMDHLTHEQLLLGVTNPPKGQKVLNWIILFAKFFIQKRKLFFQGSIPLIVFLREARDQIHMEKRACSWENKSNKFRPWQRIYNALG